MQKSSSLSALLVPLKPGPLPQPAKPAPQAQFQVAGLHHLLVKPAPQPPQPLPLPPPKAISEIQCHHNVGSDGIETGRNISYKRTNPDGTEDRVCRIFDVYARGTHLLLVYQGPLTEHINPARDPMYHQEILSYIMACETQARLKDFKPANVNVHRCGALLATTRLPPPSPLKPTVDAEIAQLKAQIAAQNQQIKALSDQVAASKTLDAAQRQQLIILQQNLQQLQAMLINVLCNNP